MDNSKLFPKDDHIKSDGTILITDKNIADEHCAEIAQKLTLENQVITFDLTGSNVTGRGLANFSNAILNSRTLKKINLSNNKIGDNDVGLSNFFSSISLNTSIIELDLSSNQLGFNSANQIAEILRKNSVIQVIDLKFNKIGREGAITILNALGSNHSIKYIHLAGNSCENSTLMEIDRILETNRIGIHYNKTQSSSDYIFLHKKEPLQIVNNCCHASCCCCREKNTTNDISIDTRYESLLMEYRRLEEKNADILRAYDELNISYKNLEEKCIKDKEFFRVERIKFEETILALKGEINIKDERKKEIIGNDQQLFEIERRRYLTELEKGKITLRQSQEKVLFLEKEVETMKNNIGKITLNYDEKMKNIDIDRANLINQMNIDLENVKADLARSLSANEFLKKEISNLNITLHRSEEVNRDDTLNIVSDLKAIQNENIYLKSEIEKLNKLRFSVDEENKVLTNKYNSFESVLEKNKQLKFTLSKYAENEDILKQEINKLKLNAEQNKQALQNDKTQVINEIRILESENQRIKIELEKVVNINKEFERENKVLQEKVNYLLKNEESNSIIKKDFEALKLQNLDQSQKLMDALRAIESGDLQFNNLLKENNILKIQVNDQNQNIKTLGIFENREQILVSNFENTRSELQTFKIENEYLKKRISELLNEREIGKTNVIVSPETESTSEYIMKPITKYVKKTIVVPKETLYKGPPFNY